MRNKQHTKQYMHIILTIEVLTQMKIHGTQYHTLHKKFRSTHPLMLSARWFRLGSESSVT